MTIVLGSDKLFNFIRKYYKVFAPVSGKIMSLSEVPETIFAERLMGDGIAIEPESDIICAPAEGTIRMIFGTNHGFAMSMDNGIELLIHIGLDTVALKGKYFERLVEVGDRVELGQPVVKIDSRSIKDSGYNLITPVLIINVERVKELQCTNSPYVMSGQDEIITYTIK